LAKAVLRLTEGVRPIVDTRDHKFELGEIRTAWLTNSLPQCVQRRFTQDIGLASRELVSRQFGVPIEVQLRIEAYLENLVEIAPLDLPEIQALMREEWLLMYEKTAWQLAPGRRY